MQPEKTNVLYSVSTRKKEESNEPHEINIIKFRNCPGHSKCKRMTTWALSKREKNAYNIINEPTKHDPLLLQKESNPADLLLEKSITEQIISFPEIRKQINDS